jgi:imidazoleglycerol-phosphate dehydratase/histidinol-phosphatase
MPSQICVCRKPQSGMGLYFRDKYKLDLSKCIMVGDRKTDNTFADRLGIKYYTEKQFFKR